MNYTMKPINTVYRGYKFRSRLEARWAVFLSELKADWKYEVEGYVLSGMWYLPDFFVSDWNCWIEVKPIKPTETELQKVALISKASGQRVLIIYGEPWADQESEHYGVLLFDSECADDPNMQQYWGGGVWSFAQGRKCEEEIHLVNEEGFSISLKSVPHERDEKFPLSGIDASRIMAALVTARQKRFEHGAQ